MPEYVRVERTGPSIRGALRAAASDELPESVWNSNRKWTMTYSDPEFNTKSRPATLPSDEQVLLDAIDEQGPYYLFARVYPCTGIARKPVGNAHLQLRRWGYVKIVQKNFDGAGDLWLRVQ